MAGNYQLAAPVSGRIIPLADVPDAAFASGKLGDGFGVLDTPGGEVLAPASGSVTMVAKTGHAVGLKTENGLDILVHLGIDTVELKGEPFALTVTKGDRVEAGDSLGTMDAQAISSAGKSTCVIVTVINSATMLDSLEATTGETTAGSACAALIPSVGTAPADASGASEASSPEEEPPLAEAIVEGIGGADNVRSVTHCISRVRFYLHDEGKADTERIAGLDGVIDVVRAAGQYQVVIGPGVEDVYKDIVKIPGVVPADGEETQDSAPERQRPDSAWGWIKLGFSSLIGVITGSMIPVIGLLAASGIIKGVLALLTNFELVDSEGSTYLIINAMSDAVFFFLPVFVGFTAARRLGADPIIVSIIGGVLCYPDIVELASAEGEHAILGMPLNATFFGLPFHMAGYSYSIFPIIAAAWLASVLEPWLKKAIPTVVRMIFVPLLEVVIVSLAVFLVLGPVIMFISTGISNALQGLLDLSGIVSGLIIGGLYQCLVIFGLHWAVIPIVSQQIAIDGSSPLNAIISATMVAQGGAVLAVLVKSKILKIKELSGSAAISAFCGITEPAMYGINLKYGRVFLMACIGGAAGGFLTGLFDVNMWGFTGSLVGFTSFVNPAGLDFSFWGFLIASGASAAVAFTLTYFFGFTDADVEQGRTVKKIRLGNREPVAR